MLYGIVLSVLVTGSLVAAELVNRSGAVIGYASVFDKGSGLLLKLTAEGLPVGWHAVHIHATGDCSDFSEGFTLSGPHFNPHSTAHGALDQRGYHAGDLANVYVGESGSIHIEQIIPGMTASEYRTFFEQQGPALIIHEDPDDYITQPTGGAGQRIACAVLPSAGKLDPVSVEATQHQDKSLQEEG